MSTDILILTPRSRRLLASLDPFVRETWKMVLAEIEAEARGWTEDDLARVLYGDDFDGRPSVARAHSYGWYHDKARRILWGLGAQAARTEQESTAVSLPRLVEETAPARSRPPGAPGEAVDRDPAGGAPPPSRGIEPPITESELRALHGDR